jgi:hypothetical protein
MESVLKIMKFIYHKNIKLKIYLKTFAFRQGKNEAVPGRGNGLTGREKMSSNEILLPGMDLNNPGAIEPFT